MELCTSGTEASESFSRRNGSSSVMRLNWGPRKTPAPPGSQMRDLIYGVSAGAPKPSTPTRPTGASATSSALQGVLQSGTSVFRQFSRPMVLTTFLERYQPDLLEEAELRKKNARTKRTCSDGKPSGKGLRLSRGRTRESSESEIPSPGEFLRDAKKPSSRRKRGERTSRRRPERRIPVVDAAGKGDGDVGNHGKKRERKGDWKTQREVRYPMTKPGRGRCPEVLRTKDGVPDGWTKVVCKSRGNCLTQYRYWVYFVAPTGEEIRKKPQLDEYFRAHSVREVDKLRLKFTVPKDFKEQPPAASGVSVEETSNSAVSCPAGSFDSRSAAEESFSEAESVPTRVTTLSGGPRTEGAVEPREFPVEKSESRKLVGEDETLEDTSGGDSEGGDDVLEMLREDLDMTPEPNEAPAADPFSARIGSSEPLARKVGEAGTISGPAAATDTPRSLLKSSTHVPTLTNRLESVVNPEVFLDENLYADIIAKQPKVVLRRLKPDEIPESVRGELEKCEGSPPRVPRKAKRLAKKLNPEKLQKPSSSNRRKRARTEEYESESSSDEETEASGAKRRRRTEINKRNADVSELTHDLISESTEGLPEGWKKLVLRVHLSSGKTPLRTCFVAPDGSRLWVMNRLLQYLKKKKIECDPSVFSFARLKHERGAVPVDDMNELSHTQIHRTTEGLPEGWTKVLFRLGKGPKKGHVRVCYLSPAGNRLWQIKDLERYVDERGLDVDTSLFEFKAGKALYDVKECPLVIIAETTKGVPEGWTRVTYRRQDGKKSAGKKLYYYVTPAGKKLWSSTALKEFAKKHASELDLSKFDFSEHALRRRQAWELRAQGKLPAKTSGTASEEGCVEFGKSQYREVCRTTEGVPEGWTKVIFKPSSGARAGALRPCFLSPDRRWIWNGRHLRMYLKKHGDGTVEESMFDFTVCVGDSGAVLDLRNDVVSS